MLNEKRLIEKQFFCNMNQAILYTNACKSYSVPIKGFRYRKSGMTEAAFSYGIWLLCHYCTFF